MFTIAHVTDTHFGNRPGITGRNIRVVDAVATLNPDVTIVTGDVADHGTAEEYAEARDLLGQLDMPVLWVPGNHDVREAFAETVLGKATAEPMDVVFEIGGFRFLLLDSLVPASAGERVDHGELAQASLDWLDAELDASSMPCFVSLHHPPVSLGLDLTDRIGLREPEDLEAVIANHPHVLATLVGHAHTAAVTTFADRPLLVGGAVSSTLPLPAEGRPVIWEDAPPSFAIHLVTDDLRLVTHWRAL